MAFLVCINNGADRSVLPLGKAVLLIGRDEDADLQLQGTGISRNHASISVIEGVCVLKDNGSTNGSFVNGERVSVRALTHGDRIRFGEHVFLFDGTDAAPGRLAESKVVELDRSGQSYRGLVEIGDMSAGGLRVMLAGGVGESPAAQPAARTLPAEGLLAPLSGKDREALAAMGTFLSAAAGEVVVREGGPQQSLFLVLSGRFVASKEGAAIGEILPGEFFGEVNIFDPAAAMCSVAAAGPVEYWAIARKELESFINQHRGAGCALLISLAAGLGRRLRTASVPAAVPVAVAVAANEASSSKKAVSISGWVAAAVASLIAATAAFAWINERSRAAAAVAENQRTVAAIQGELAVATEEADRLEEELVQVRARLQPLPIPAAPASAASAPVVQPKADPPPPTTQRGGRNPESSAPAPAVVAVHNTPAPAVEGSLPRAVLLTKKTSVPVVVDGEVSGSVVLADGHEFKVLGATATQVLVEMGGSTVRVPRANTNFDQAPRSAPAASPIPIATSTPAPRSSLNKAKADPVPQPVTLEDLDRVGGQADLSDLMEELWLFKKADPKGDPTKLLRGHASKWRRAGGTALDLLKNPSLPAAYRDWLGKVAVAAEMFELGRYSLLEAKLAEIDKDWVALKARQRLEGAEDGGSD